MARIDGHFVKLIWRSELVCLFVCWLIGLWAVLFTCVAVSETFSGLSTTWAVMSQALSHYIFKMVLCPFEIPVFGHELVLPPSRSMPLTHIFTL